MKNTLYLLILIPLLLFSCEMIPEASFYADTDTPVVGEAVYFTNESINADRFEWEFGDNTFSEEPNPVHEYNGSGTYMVTLTAFSRAGISDKAYLEVNVLIPTLLEIEVLEYYNEYPVEGASVRLYPTLTDWDDESNIITEGITGANGKTVFSGLGSFVYYVDVWEENHNNYTLRDEDVGFIRTDQIMPNEINRFVAFVDYVGNKGDGKRDRSVSIIKMDRKAGEK
jgi:PKD repeat protein